MNRKLPFTYEEFKSLYSKVPRLCVDLVVKTHQGVLLVKREKHGWAGQWHLPGGTVFYREKIEDAVKRIAEEELEMAVDIEKILGYLEYFSEEKERGFGYSVALVFLCTPVNTDPKLDNLEVLAKYFDSPPDNTIQEQKAFLNKL